MYKYVGAAALIDSMCLCVPMCGCVCVWVGVGVIVWECVNAIAWVKVEVCRCDRLD